MCASVMSCVSQEDDLYALQMIDSRERNSADGSLVQKARRQVEIFQSQENSGRSFQVVRASQWSSSRATDCGFDIPITNKPSVSLARFYTETKI